MKYTKQDLEDSKKAFLEEVRADKVLRIVRATAWVLVASIFGLPVGLMIGWVGWVVVLLAEMISFSGFVLLLVIRDIRKADIRSKYLLL